MPRKNSKHAYELGYEGERAVFEILTNQGRDVVFGDNGEYDLKVGEHLTIEVKTAELSGRTDSKYKRWQFCLYPHPGRDLPFCEDVLILRCQSETPCHFIIPGFLVPGGLSKIDITTEDPHKHRGKWEVFRECWAVIDVMEAAVTHWRSQP